LDKTYPLNKRSEVEVIGGAGGTLANTIAEMMPLTEIPRDLKENFLNFKGFDNLTELYIHSRAIEVASIDAFPRTLKRLQLSNNGFKRSTLKPFEDFVNLEWLDIGSSTTGGDVPKFISRFSVRYND